MTDKEYSEKIESYKVLLKEAYKESNKFEQAFFIAIDLIEKSICCEKCPCYEKCIKDHSQDCNERLKGCYVLSACTGVLLMGFIAGSHHGD